MAKKKLEWCTPQYHSTSSVAKNGISLRNYSSSKQFVLVFGANALKILDLEDGRLAIAVCENRIYFKADVYGWKLQKDTLTNTRNRLVVTYTKNIALRTIAETKAGEYSLRYDSEQKLYYMDLEEEQNDS